MRERYQHLEIRKGRRLHSYQAILIFFCKNTRSGYMLKVRQEQKASKSSNTIDGYKSWLISLKTHSHPMRGFISIYVVQISIEVFREIKSHDECHPVQKGQS